jgi:hypothetical protein
MAWKLLEMGNGQRPGGWQGLRRVYLLGDFGDNFGLNGLGGGMAVLGLEGYK